MGTESSPTGCDDLVLRDLESRLGATAVQSDCVMPRVAGGQWGHVRATLPGVSAVSGKRGDGFVGTGESGNGWVGGCG